MVEVRTQLPGMTAAQYDIFIAHVLDQLTTFPGFVAHASGPTDGGYRLTEIWTSQEAHERWLHDVILSTIQQLSLAVQPTPPQYFPTDHVVTR